MSVESSPREVTTSGRENLLLKAAAPLLNAVVQIRQAATHDDPAGLRQSLTDEIRLFEQRCKQAGLPFEMIIGARYCVCSAWMKPPRKRHGARAASGPATACW